MLKSSTCPDLSTLTPPAGKAQIVIGRTTDFGKAIEFQHYLNRSFIGSTKGYSFFTTNVDPGEYSLAAKSENLNMLRVRLEQDKTYYLKDNVLMGIWKARVEMSPTTAALMKLEMGAKCTYYVRDSSKVADFEEKAWTNAVNEIGADFFISFPAAPSDVSNGVKRF